MKVDPIFAEAQRTVQNMDDLEKFILKHWGNYVQNAWVNSPEKQGNFDKSRTPTIKPTWSGGLGLVHYEERTDQKYGPKGNGWLVTIRMELEHPKTCKGYWFKGAAYFKGTGVTPTMSNRKVESWSQHIEHMTVSFFMAREDWPALASSRDQMLVAAKLMPEMAAELPYFVE